MRKLVVALSLHNYFSPVCGVTFKEGAVQLPKEVVPILEKITARKGCEIEFWNCLNGDDLTDMFLEFSGELMMSDIEEDSIPEGYIIMAYVYYWETNCQFSGWYAIENKQDEMEIILSCYRKVNLSSEANALEAAVRTWFSTNQDHDKVGEAYRAVPNEYSEEGDRFDYLGSYFSKNAKNLFYV